MKCYEILWFLKNKCSECFKNDPRPKSQLSQQLVELSDIKPKPMMPSRQYPMVNSVQLKQQTDPETIFSKIKLKEKQQQISKQLQENVQPVRDEQFLSIQSITNIQNPSSSKKLINQLQKIKKYTTSQKKQTRISQSNSQWCETPTMQKLNVDGQIQKFKDLFKIEYGKTRIVSFRVNHAVRLRMQGTAMFTLLFRKLEDFKINNMNDSGNLGYCFINKSKTLANQYLKDQKSLSGYKRSRIISYYSVKCNTSTITQLLQAFSSKQAIRIIHGFTKPQAVEYEGENLGVAVPILQVRHSQDRFKDGKYYHVATQVRENSATREQSREVVSVCYSLDENEQNWQRIVRIVYSFVSEVEVYCQSFEELMEDEEVHFRKKFDLLQQYLVRLHLIPAN